MIDIKKFSIGFACLVAGIAIHIASRQSAIAPQAHKFEAPEPLPEDSRLTPAKILWRGLKGPESFAVDPNTGLVYTGLADGQVVAVDTQRSGNTPMSLLYTGNPRRVLPLPCGTYQTEPICGRPLSLAFDKRGKLIVADAYKGLLSVDTASGKMKTLTKSSGGKSLRFPNSIVIGESENIYVTDSTRFARKDYMLDFMETRPRGRLVKYDPKAKKATTIKTGLYFPNGLLISSDESYAIIAESSMKRLVRVDLKNKKSKPEVVVDRLPGFPDGIMWVDQARTRVLVSCPTRDSALLRWIAGEPDLRAFIMKGASYGFLEWFSDRRGLLVEVDIVSGKIVDVYQDPTGKVNSISSTSVIGDHLYIGSFHSDSNYVSRLPWPLPSKK